MGGGKGKGGGGGGYSARNVASQVASANRITIGDPSKAAAAVTSNSSKAGRGHKQKGAGTVIVAKAAVVTQDGVVLKPHERLPTQLLQEYCQREKRPAPKYKPTGKGHQHIVWLNDAKNPKHDMSFLPSSTDFESISVAKNFTALLALFDLQRSMPLENKLPDPYGPTWRSMAVAHKEKEKAEKAAKGGRGKPVAAAAAGAGTDKSEKPEKAAPVLVAIKSTGPATTPAAAAAEAAMVPFGLDSASADWLCASCNQQNFATLQSGKARTKCFKCGAAKTAECELVASTAATPAAAPITRAGNFTVAKDDHSDIPSVPSFGFSDAPKKSGNDKNSGLGGSQFKMGKAKVKPQARHDLTNKHQHNSAAEADRVQAEIKQAKKRRQNYFDALKRANRPTTVLLSPTLRFQLERALGLDAEAAPEAEIALTLGSDFSSVDEYLKSLEGTKAPLKLGSASGAGTSGGGLGLLPETECGVPPGEQRALLKPIADTLVSEGFREAAVVASLIFLSSSYEGIIDELQEAGWVPGSKPAPALWRRVVQDSLLERLCLSLDNQALPKRFDARRNEGTLAVHVHGKSRSEQLPPQPPSEVDVSTAATGRASRLRDYGWTPAETKAATAVCAAAGNVAAEIEGIHLAAALKLVAATQEAARQAGDFAIPTFIGSSSSSSDGSNSVDTMREECEMLESIFGENRPVEVVQSEDGSLLLLSVPVALGTGIKSAPQQHFLSGKADEPTWLDVLVHKHMDYPAQPPLLLLRNAAARNAGILPSCQLALWRKAADFVGESCVYQLVLWLEEARGGFVEDVLCSAACSPGAPIGIAGALSRPPSRQPSDGNLNERAATAADVTGEESTASQTRTTTNKSSAGAQKPRNNGFWATSTRPEGELLLSAEAAMQRIRTAPEGGTRKGKERDTYLRMLKGRKTLPAWKTRDNFLTTVAQHRGMVVTGETGCGKTTQIPQFILEVEPAAKILVCQPRRLAAVGVATRVAEEMACAIGDDVGYMVRGQSAISKKTRMAFCTYGVMLRRLLADPDLPGIDYVILDEIHERGVDSDFALALLAAALSRTGCRFKLILMSATIATDRFADYLGRATAGALDAPGKAYATAPVLFIPGYTFDVKEYYKDVFEAAVYGNGGGNREGDGGGNEDDEGRGGGRPRAPRPGDLDYELLTRLVCKLAAGDGSSDGMLAQATGSVLVFLPGVGEISRFCTAMEQAWRGARHLKVLPLHAGTNPQDQKRIFQPVGHHELKIIAATNVAEASITIPDVSVVVDSCKVKETDFDAEKQMNALLLKFASKDSLRQRRGRAGRVAAGRCFRAVTSNTYANLPNHSVPEILRASIDGLVLQIKSMSDTAVHKESVGTQLRRCPDPPPPNVIATSEAILTRMQALDQDGNITPLGRHLAQLPCAPKVGRILIYGVLLGATLPMANVAALLSARDPFLSSFDQEGRDRLNDIKERFGAASGGRSDQLVITSVMAAFEREKGMSAQRKFCEANQLSFLRMQDIRNLTRDFLGDLANLGLLSGVSEGQSLDASCNCNVGRPRVVAAAVSAGLYPQVSRIMRPPKRFEEVMGGAFEKEDQAKEIKFYVPESSSRAPPASEVAAAAIGPTGEYSSADPYNPRSGGGVLTAEEAELVSEKGSSADISTAGMFRVFVHPSSIHFGNSSYAQSQFVMYGETRLQVTPGKENKSYIQDITEVGAYPLLFFGGKLEAQYLAGTITVDGWLKFSASGKLVALVQALRRALDDILLEKINKSGGEKTGGAVADHYKHPLMTTVFAMLDSRDGLR